MIDCYCGMVDMSSHSSITLPTCYDVTTTASSFTAMSHSATPHHYPHHHSHHASMPVRSVPLVRSPSWNLHTAVQLTLTDRNERNMCSLPSCRMNHPVLTRVIAQIGREGIRMRTRGIGHNIREKEQCKTRKKTEKFPR